MKNKQGASGKSRLRRTVENRGFYIALFSLVVIMGFSIYARKVQLEKKNSDVAFDDNAWQEALSESGVEFKGSVTPSENSQNEPQSGENSEKKTDDDTVKQPETKKENIPDENSADNTTVQQTIQTSADTKPQNGGQVSMQLPCAGKIIESCSLDELVYCGSMEDWRTHNGLDIAAAEGDPVKAAAAGTVSQVYEDDLLGVVVTIDHGNNLTSLYGNLQSYDFIRVGTAVQAGDIIGGVGKPGALEADKGPHLHFEVHKNGEYQNPDSFLST